MTTWLLLISMMVVAFSGVPGLLLRRHSMPGQWIATALNVIGSAIGGAALILHRANPENSLAIRFPWALPQGNFSVAVDDLSLLFLIPMLLISALGSIYGLSYWNQREHPNDGKKLCLCWGLMTAAMMMVVLARDGVLFLIAWEIMALTAFFLVTTEENKPEVRFAGWVYLVAAHVGTLCLFGFFALLSYATGSFELWPTLPASVSPQMTIALFVLGAVGFALKAGVIPLHIWLPGAHANAPSHVSAILSGVLLKTGVYGVVRLAAILPHPPVWWGATLLVAGAISAILGIAYAAAQHDLKRLLAYSSIENIGIIFMGIGLATLGRSLDRPDFVVLGLGGALLHVLNHSLFKPLLFMGSGGILHAAHTRQMDRLGGLGKSMPRTFILFLIGAVAISGLPPLNGFVGELFLYIGFLRTTTAVSGSWGWVALSAPALALVGALAVGSFVKLLGTVFSGAPRSEQAAHAHDPDSIILAPMWLLAGCCVVIGLFPVLAIGLLDRAIAGWADASSGPRESLAGYVPLGWLTIMSVGLLIVVGAGVVWLARHRSIKTARSAGTWDCGYARPTARMQYSGSSFSQFMVELLSWVLLPRRRPPRVSEVFAERANFSSDVPDVVLDRSLLPACGRVEWLLGWARFIQRGPIQVYLLYVLGILLVLLLFA